MCSEPYTGIMDAQVKQVACAIIRSLSPEGVIRIGNYLQQEHGQFRADYTLLRAGLRTSQLYRDLDSPLSSPFSAFEMAKIECEVLRQLKARS